MITLAIHHWRKGLGGPEQWTYSLAHGGRIAAPVYQTCAEATAGVIEFADEFGCQVQATGHPDREMLREAGIKYVDSRGNKRRGKGSQAKQKALWDAKMAARCWHPKPCD